MVDWAAEDAEVTTEGEEEYVVFAVGAAGVVEKGGGGVDGCDVHVGKRGWLELCGLGVSVDIILLWIYNMRS